MAHISTSVLCLVLVVAFVTAAANGILAQYSTELVVHCLARESLPLCDADAICRGRFYMDLFAPPLKNQLFEYLLDLYIRENGIQTPLVLAQIMPINLPHDRQQAPALLVQTPSPAIPFDLANLFYSNNTSSAHNDYDSRFLVNCSRLLHEMLLQTANNVIPSPLLLLLDFSSNNTNDSSFAALQATLLGRGLTWWLHSLRLADFCTENEYYMIGEGCQCKSGKQCHEVDPGSYLLPKVSFLITVLVLTALVLYGCYTISTEASEGIRQMVGVISALLTRAADHTM